MQKTKYLLALFLVLYSSSFVSTPAYAASPTPPSMEVTYPGLLPDHPFYFLKVAKDNVIGFFKGKPEDRAKYALLQSEKYLGAGHLLITEKKDYKLARISLDNANQALKEAIKQTESAKKEGIATNELCQKIKDTAKKQLEIYTFLEGQYTLDDALNVDSGKKQASELFRVASSMHP